ncbi:alanine racemase [Lancefieldella parvula]|uniref:alanine racemase n=1 Tax=Lancefieldella parvula TaxID=1382 RepID=UPI0028D8DA38|nr:alanine racemase [Lancefieldella parvula]
MSAYPQDRWAWIEIDLSAVRHNVKAFKAQLNRGVKMMCVVKADAYGHGAAQCAKAMQSVGADQFAVATVDEGVELRCSGIDNPILVLSEPPVTSIPDLVRFDIMPSVYTVDFALAYGEASAAANKVGRYHLAIDTGMTRIGVRREDLLEVRGSIDFHRGLECAGTFTHFATADVLDNWDFDLQVNRFIEAVTALKNAGYELGLVHADNTPGTVLHKDIQFDMVRVGIGLYGLHPSKLTIPRIDLQPVMSVRGRVTRVIYPAVGDGVSYGMTWRVPRNNIQVATVPIGYADGLARSLSNRMDVLTRGDRVRQVGNICMDQFMIAVDTAGTHANKPAHEIRHGDVVTLIGKDGDQEITSDEMADLRETINYEVVCNFGARLDKVYI